MLLFFDGEEAFKSWSATDSIYGSRHLVTKWSKSSFQTADSTTTQLNRMVSFRQITLILAFYSVHFLCYY